MVPMSSEAALYNPLKAMVSNGLRGLPVVDDGGLKGIPVAMDVVRFLGFGRAFECVKSDDVETP